MIDTTRRCEGDCIQELFNELRSQLPPLPSLVSNADARMAWLSGMAQIIAALPTAEQRWACVVLLANDLVTLRYPGMPLSMAYGWLAKELGVETPCPYPFGLSCTATVRTAMAKRG